MISVDDQIRLAEELAKALPEVTRNDWTRWAQLAKANGLDSALQNASRLAGDFTLRPAIKRSNQLIADAVSRQRRALAALAPAEREAVFGYVARLLMIQTARGSLRD
jgi:hypothetical protein